MITPPKSELGWIIEIPDEMAEILNIEPGSIAILYPKEHALETEILPPPSTKLKEDFERLNDKYTAKRGNRKKFQRAMAKVPKVQPEKHDRLPS
ncbi:MAG: hypothetical protein DMF75_05225 [Acidobacteria bacterium]|nr:MAG: hypothetical protein DMF75_05225 [Acidobacteriota bacterium]